MRPCIIFVIGTDTGVGKTVLTGLLLSHLRQRGNHALALKPFCSGGRADAELLHNLQDGDLTLEEINPFHFKEPLAPLAAARLRHRKIPLTHVLDHIRAVAERLAAPNLKVQSSTPPILLIEGAGGLLSPLGEPLSSPRTTHLPRRSPVKADHATGIYTILDLITELSKPPPPSRFAFHSSRFTLKILLVSPNRLGTINHTLLTLDLLRQAGSPNPVVVLNDLLPQRKAGLDGQHNGALLSEIAKPVQIVRLPYVGKGCTERQVKERAKRIRDSLRKMLTLTRP